MSEEIEKSGGMGTLSVAGHLKPFVKIIKDEHFPPNTQDQEIHLFAIAIGITQDERLGTSHWGVPGHDGDYGFGGHCFPKDLSALLYLTNELGTINNVLQATKKTNDVVRKNKDWEQMKGRAVS